MKYICTFHTEELSLVDTVELHIKPDYSIDDFITLENEIYRISDIKFNHDIFNNRIFVYIEVRNINEEEKDFIDSLPNANGE